MGASPTPLEGLFPTLYPAPAPSTDTSYWGISSFSDILSNLGQWFPSLGGQVMTDNQLLNSYNASAVLIDKASGGNDALAQAQKDQLLTDLRAVQVTANANPASATWLYIVLAIIALVVVGGIVRVGR